MGEAVGDAVYGEDGECKLGEYWNGGGRADGVGARGRALGTS